MKRNEQKKKKSSGYVLEDNVFQVSYQSADYGMRWLLYNTRSLLCGKRLEWFVRQQQIIKMKFGIWK